MICAECSAAVEDNSHYCPRCGHPTTSQGEFEPTALGDLPGVTATPSRAASAAATLTEQEISALLTRANLHRVRKQWAEAVDCCIAILRSHPGNHTAHSLLGDVYRDQGKLDDAAQWYRMAVDLWANPSDSDKLNQVEQERGRRARVQARAFMGQSRMLPMSASGLLGSGTANLMGGVSPRRWLRTVTAVSVAFMGLLIVAVVGSQMQHRAQQAPHQVISGVPVSGASFQSGGKPTSVSSSFVPLPSGFTAAARPVMTMQNPPPRQPAIEMQPSPVSQIPIAPVTGIQPMQPVVGASVSGEGSQASNARVSPLSGGVHTVQVYHGANDGTAAVLLGIPSVNTGDSQLEARLVRNVFRAARAEMNVNPSVTHVTVSVQPDNAPGQYVIVAELDRPNVYEANIDGDSVSNLEQRLSSLNWWIADNASAPATPTTTADSSPDTQ